uniref:Uncharacterized protein n=1 Tax=Arundo donax TaxID=35708 RepID=A0A0A9B5Z2_ARUDO
MSLIRSLLSSRRLLFRYMCCTIVGFPSYLCAWFHRTSRS